MTPRERGDVLSANLCIAGLAVGASMLGESFGFWGVIPWVGLFAVAGFVRIGYAIYDAGRRSADKERP